MTDVIATIEQLEACIGVAGLPVKMKIIDHLDAAAAAWIVAAPLAFAGFGGRGGPSIHVAGGTPGFATVAGKSKLVLPRDALDDLGPLEVGQGAGVLFLVPGIGETLRVNGRVLAANDAAIEIAVEECFLHCAKALIRSNFWAPKPGEAPADAAAFLNTTRFLALATCDKDGRVDVSPKGDPAGLLIRADGGVATLAERPGNRLAFGYRNIIGNPAIAAVALIPGVQTIATLTGHAHLSTSEALRGAFEVEGKTPILATVIEGLHIKTEVSGGLARSGIWSQSPATPTIDPSATLVAHVKLNKTRGLQAVAIRTATTRGIVAKGLEQAYKNTLY